METSSRRSQTPHSAASRPSFPWFGILGAVFVLAGGPPTDLAGQVRGGAGIAHDPPASRPRAPVPKNLEEVRASLADRVRPWVVDRGLSLSATVGMRVRADGSVDRVEVVEGPLPLPFREQLIAALRRLRFRPAEVGGRPVPTRVLLPFFFREGEGAR